MMILQSLLLASSLMLMNSTPATYSNPDSDSSNIELNTQAAREILTQAIRQQISYPTFAAEPQQEVIVRIHFQVDENNRIDLLKVSGNDRKVVRYVEENLQGKAAGEQPIVPGVTFVSTLRFVH